METPKIRVPFSRKPIFVSTGDEIYDLFQNAVIPLMAEPWHSIDTAQCWQDVLPYPERLAAIMPTISPMIAVTQPSRAAGLRAIYQTERNEWERYSRAWIESEKHNIKEQKRKAHKLIDEAIPTINGAYKKRLKPEDVFAAWVNSVGALSQSEFTALKISTKEMSAFLAVQANGYINRVTLSEVHPPVSGKDIENAILETQRANIKAKQKIIPLAELLVNFTQEDLHSLLVHVKFRDKHGVTTLRNVSALYGLWHALRDFGLIKKTSQEKGFNSLRHFMNLKTTTAVKAGWTNKEKIIKAKTITYLNKAGYKPVE